MENTYFLTNGTNYNKAIYQVPILLYQTLYDISFSLHNNSMNQKTETQVFSNTFQFIQQ